MLQPGIAGDLNVPFHFMESVAWFLERGNTLPRIKRKSACIPEMLFSAFLNVSMTFMGFKMKIHMLKFASAFAGHWQIGIFTAESFSAAQSHNKKIENVFELFPACCAVHNLLDSAGIPHTYEESDTAFLCGIHALSLKDAELKKILSGTLMLDAHAAEIFLDKNLSGYIGISGVREFHRSGGELAVDEETFGEYANTYMQTRTAPPGSLREFIPLPEAKEITAFVDHDLNKIAPGVITFENALGGKMILLPYVINENCAGAMAYHLVCHQRQRMFHKLLKNILPLRFADGAEIMVQYWKETNRTILAIASFTYDERKEYPVITDLPLENAEYLDDDGILKKLPFSEGRIRLVLKPFRPRVLFL